MYQGRPMLNAAKAPSNDPPLGSCGGKLVAADSASLALLLSDKLTELSSSLVMSVEAGSASVYELLVGNTGCG